MLPVNFVAYAKSENRSWFIIKITALLNHVKFAEELGRLNKTQEEFAEDMNISVRYLRKLLTSDINVSISKAYGFSQEFG